MGVYQLLSHSDCAWFSHSNNVVSPTQVQHVKSFNWLRTLPRQWKLEQIPLCSSGLIRARTSKRCLNNTESVRCRLKASISQSVPNNFPEIRSITINLAFTAERGQECNSLLEMPSIKQVFVSESHSDNFQIGIHSREKTGLQSPLLKCQSLLLVWARFCPLYGTQQQPYGTNVLDKWEVLLNL